MRDRKGVASVVGMLFLALIFMAAVGAQVYISGLESSSAEGASQALGRQAVHDREGVSFSGQGGGVAALDTGPSAVTAVGMVLEFENGTSYVLGNGTSPRFVPSTILPSASVSLQSLVPAGRCSPGLASCLKKFDAIVQGGPVAGRGVALVTSMGNAFWYYPSTAAAGAGTGGTSHYWLSSPQSTGSSSLVPIPGLAFTGAAGAFYEVTVDVAYYQSTSSSPGLGLGVSLPSGSGFLFCGGMFWSNPVSTSSTGHPGNTCSGTPNTPLGATTSPQTYCTSSGGACEFTGTAYVWFGSSSGTFQLTFEALSGGTATVIAGSVLAVSQLS